jgi:hypothetical protein
MRVTCITAALMLWTGSQNATPSAFIAFRADDQHIVVNLEVFDLSERQVDHPDAVIPNATYGYSYFAPPDAWVARVPKSVRSASRWVVYTRAGQTVGATLERFVGGGTGCQDAIGALLRIDANDLQAFAAVSAKYYVASPGSSSRRSSEAASPLGQLSTPALSAEQRRALESLFTQLLTRELPKVRAEASDDIARMASSDVDYHRSWARERKNLDAALDHGRARLKYDLQALILSPDAVPLYFARVEWMVGERQAFAVSLWIKSGDAPTIVQANLRPAAWLRTFEFQGKIAREHLGMVLNVLDLDGDGWGEVLLVGAGYESTWLSLEEYSPKGFDKTGTEFAHGC